VYRLAFGDLFGETIPRLAPPAALQLFLGLGTQRAPARRAFLLCHRGEQLIVELMKTIPRHVTGTARFLVCAFQQLPAHIRSRGLESWHQRPEAAVCIQQRGQQADILGIARFALKGDIVDRRITGAARCGHVPSRYMAIFMGAPARGLPPRRG
jgi:hypothetical protein